MGGSVSDDFKILFATNNASPLVPFNTQSSFTFNAGQNISINNASRFTDSNGDTLTYASSNLPGSLTLDSHTGVVSGPGLSGGLYAYSITATDPGGLSVTAFNSIMVKVPNAPPVLGPDVSAYIDSSLTHIPLHLNLPTDANNDALTLVGLTQPVGDNYFNVNIIHKSNGTNISIPQDANVISDFALDRPPFALESSFTYRVSDGQATVGRTFTFHLAAESVPLLPTPSASLNGMAGVNGDTLGSGIHTGARGANGSNGQPLQISLDADSGTNTIYGGNQLNAQTGGSGGRGGDGYYRNVVGNAFNNTGGAGGNGGNGGDSIYSIIALAGDDLIYGGRGGDGGKYGARGMNGADSPYDDINGHHVTAGGRGGNGGDGGDATYYIWGGDGADDIHGGQGGNGGVGQLIISSSGGTPGNGGDSAYKIYGEGGNDIIHGGNGGNTSFHSGISTYLIDGGASNDTIYGGAGGSGTYTLNGGDGNDTLTGGAGGLGTYTLNGSVGNDTLTGGAGGPGTYTLNGDAGNDTLTGGAGGSGTYTLNGGDGNDTLTGGAEGSGTYNLNGGNGDDILHTSNISLNSNYFINGGDGHDTLSLDGASQIFSTADLKPHLSNIEVMDITGQGNNILNLLQDSSLSYDIKGNSGDQVVLQTDSPNVIWEHTPGSAIPGYEVYQAFFVNPSTHTHSLIQTVLIFDAVAVTGIE